MNNGFIRYCARYVRKKANNDSNYLAKFIMLCGRKPELNIEDNRSITKNILEENRNDTYVVYVEELFSIIDGHDDIDLLKFEEMLVEISDGVILFLESFGTAAELGAFTYLDNLSKKTLVFIDTKYSKEKSFINTGPLARITSQSLVEDELGGVIFTPFLDHGNIDFGGNNFERIVKFSSKKIISFSSDFRKIDSNNDFIQIIPSLLMHTIIDIIYLFDFIPKNKIYKYVLAILTAGVFNSIRASKIKLIFQSGNKFNDENVIMYILEMLEIWGILEKRTSIKGNVELLSINYSNMNFDNDISLNLGRTTFINDLFNRNEYIHHKLENRKWNINRYGNLYEE